MSGRKSWQQLVDAEAAEAGFANYFDAVEVSQPAADAILERVSAQTASAATVDFASFMRDALATAPDASTIVDVAMTSRLGELTWGVTLFSSSLRCESGAGSAMIAWAREPSREEALRVVRAQVALKTCVCSACVTPDGRRALTAAEPVHESERMDALGGVL